MNTINLNPFHNYRFTLFIGIFFNLVRIIKIFLNYIDITTFFLHLQVFQLDYDDIYFDLNNIFTCSILSSQNGLRTYFFVLLEVAYKQDFSSIINKFFLSKENNKHLSRNNCIILQSS